MKKAVAIYFLYLMAFELGGQMARQPTVHGIVAKRYAIMNISCQSWSSVEVMYVQPPHVRVRKRPIAATNLGRNLPGLAVRRYQRASRANRGPEQ